MVFGIRSCGFEWNQESWNIDAPRNQLNRVNQASPLRHPALVATAQITSPSAEKPAVKGQTTLPTTMYIIVHPSQDSNGVKSKVVVDIGIGPKQPWGFEPFEFLSGGYVDC